MITRKTTVVNETGLHARPASDFVLKAKSFESKITIRETESSDEPVNAKSIIRLLSIGIAQGTEIEITADGPDEKEAVDALVALIESGFGEE
ncbi:MAG: HPr family phosphocarrier protein [Oscillospiraceae bacterium]|nr:HPr family phosphocarrier protein [Oscillospiraceae bacterium]